MSRKYFRTVPAFVVALIVAAALALGAYATPLVQAFAEGENTAALSTIIDHDDDGTELMYTTLLDADGKVVATNDPNREVDSKYKFASEGGDDAGVKAGDQITVHFRMASVTPNGVDGDGTGVQEGVTYTAALPTELVPVAEGSDGTKLVDTETTFFNSGSIEAKGGIYTTDSGYELRMNFSNVADQVDISGEFQYVTKVSNTVTPDTIVTQNFEPGGTVKFHIAPGQEDTPKADYEITLTGQQDNSNVYHWTATAKRAEKGTFDYKQLVIVADEGSGFAVDGTTWTYTLVIDGKGYSATSSGATAKFDGIDATLSIAKASAGELISSDGSQFISQKITVQLPEGLEAQQISFQTPARPYNDYQYSNDTTDSASYTGTAILTDSDTYANVSATGTATLGLGSFSNSSFKLNAGSNNPYDSYGYITSELQTNITASNSGYYGNYYWVEYSPKENTANSIYYFNNASFIAGNQLNTSAKTATNATFGATTGVAGAGGTLFSWEAGKTLSAAQAHSISGIMSALGTNDVKLAYQIKQVFGNATTDLVYYKSTSTYKNTADKSQYAYIFVDPTTTATATTNKAKGWSEYIDDSSSITAKPGTWKLHVFNAPQSQFVMQNAYQEQGAVWNNDYDNNDGNTPQSNSNVGSITDVFSTGIYGHGAIKTTEASVGITHHRSSSMTAIRLDDDTIFWEFTVSTQTLTAMQNGSVYIGLGQGLSLGSGDNVTIDNQTLNAHTLYVRNYNATSNPWLSLGSNFGSYYNSAVDIWSMTDGSTLTPSNYSSFYKWNWSGTNLKNYASNKTAAGGGAGLVTLGFATKVTGDHASYNSYNLGSIDTSTYYATVELVAREGDVSRFVGSNGTTLPTASAGAQLQYPFKISATANTNYPEMAKSGSISKTDDGADITTGKTTTDWTLKFDGLDKIKNEVIASSPYFYTPYFTGGYSGRLFAGDSMSKSTVTDSTGKTININAGKYNYVTQIFTSGISITEQSTGGGCGPIPVVKTSNTGERYINGDTGSWYKFVNGNWVHMNTLANCWDSTKPGIYRAEIGTGGENTNQNPLTVTVFYAGDMGTSVREAFSKAGISIPSDCDFELSNSIGAESLVVEFDGLEHAQACAFQSGILYTTEMDDQAILKAAQELDDKITGVTVNMTNSATLSSWNAAGKEASSTTVSKAISAALAIYKSTPAIAEQAGVDLNDVNYTLITQIGESNSVGVSVEDYLTGWDEVDNVKTGTPRETVKHTESTDIDALMSAMTITDLTVTEVDAYGKKVSDVYSTTDGTGTFSADWTGSTLEVKPADSTAGTLFSATFQKDDGSAIAAGNQFKITYKLHLDMAAEIEDLNADALDKVAFRNSSLYQGGQLKVYNSAKASRPYESATETGGVLTVECDGNVTGTFLADPLVIKTNLAESLGNTSWMTYDWTGTIGKGSIEGKIVDAPSFELSSVPSSVTEDKKTELLKLMTQYLTVKNVKAYLVDGTTSDTPPTKSTYKSLCTDSTQVLTNGGQTSSSDTSTYSATKDGHTYTLTYSASGTREEDGKTVAVAPGFTLTGTNLAANQYLVALYDLDFDTAGFFKAAQDAGLFDASGHWAGTSSTVRYQIKNSASDNYSEASATSSRTSISSATLNKSVSANVKAGSATWTLRGNTGNAGTPGETTTITDTLTFTGEHAGAAASATTAEISSITVGRTRLDKNEYELAQTVDGTRRNLTITIKKQLEQNQNIVVVYTTVLDKSAYITGLLADGTSVTKIDYIIANSASMTIGGSTATSSISHEFEPDVPVSASKTLDSISWDSTTATFTAKASSGVAKRTDFTMTDTVDTDDITKQALELTALKVAVTDKDGNTTEYASNELPDGYTLTAAFNTPGTYNWTLVVSSLDAGNTVAVTYDLKADRATFLNAGGTANTDLKLSNKLKVTTAAGFNADASADGTIQVVPDIKKVGIILTDKKAASGNPIVQWKFAVDISQMFSKEELANLESVTVKDKLDQMLTPDMDSITVAWADGTKILKKDSDYTTNLSDDNTLEITIKNPADNPVVVITLETECAGSLDQLSNSIDLVVDGKTVGGDTTTVDNIIAVAEYGNITSATVPMWSATATKTVDGAAPGDKTFTFKLEEIDEDGNTLDGGITATATNDADGNINFGTIRFKKRPIAGTHHFKISEVADAETAAIYDIPDAVYVDVEVAKGESGNYTATATVKSGATSVTFNNVTKPENPETPETPETPESPETPGDEGNNPSSGEKSKASKPAIPQTGDATTVGLATALSLAGITALGVGITTRKKQ